MKRKRGPPTTTRRGNPNWVKGGPSPNPGGRPPNGHTLTERIRATVDPEELVAIAVSIARGCPMAFTADGRPASPDNPSAIPVDIPDSKSRIAALNWLADRGYSRPPQHVEVKTEVIAKVDFSKLSDKELDEYERLLELACEDTTKVLGSGDDDR